MNALFQKAQNSVIALQRLTGVLIHLVNKTMADVRRALWWQERTARHRYMLKLAAENERQRMQAQSPIKRCADTNKLPLLLMPECMASDSLGE